MTVFAVCMVKDEADIIAATVTRMLRQVDKVIFADNGSTDGTRDILAGLDVTVVDDPDPAYFQSKKMTKLAHLAGMKGASWVVPFDADEVWYCQFEDRIAELLEPLAPQWLTADATLYDHVATSLDDPEAADPVARHGWRRVNPAPLPKIACRYRHDLVIDQGNHNAFYDGGTTHYTDHLIVRHFPYRTPAQFVRKVRNGAQAYAATNLPDDYGAHWRGYGQILRDSGEQVLIDEVFRRWFYSDDPKDDPELIYDPA